MIPVLSPEQARAWDAAADAAGRPLRMLMESAGRAVAQVAADEFDDVLARGVLVATGTGNNGGDGWVTARTLHLHGVPVWVVEVAAPAGSPARDARQMALDDGVRLLTPDGPWPNASLIVDAVLGSGARGAPRGVAATILARLAALDLPVLAIDGPSGLDLSDGSDHGAAPAAATVTFGGVPRGVLRARQLVGEIHVKEIGHPLPRPEWPRLVDRGWARRHRAPFAVDAHKGDRGRVVIVGGSPGMTGAVRLAARGAFASGAGLVHAVVPEASASDIALAEPDVQVMGANFDATIASRVVDLVSTSDALVIGPGLGREAGRRSLVTALLAVAPRAVIDADALMLLAQDAGAIAACTDASRQVLTPHRGEFRALFPGASDLAERDPWTAAAEAAASCAATVLLKGVPTVIATHGRPTLTVAAGNPGLATGGSGDTLAGAIGAFLARGIDAQEASAVAAQATGEAAARAAAEHGVRSMRPMHVITALESVWRDWAVDDEFAEPHLVLLPTPPVG